MLLAAGADPHVRDSSGATAFELAATTARYRPAVETILRTAPRSGS
jgi:ankyrin repeat protein